jgi:hypothetical protein
MIGGLRNKKDGITFFGNNPSSLIKNLNVNL